MLLCRPSTALLPARHMQRRNHHPNQQQQQQQVQRHHQRQQPTQQQVMVLAVLSMLLAALNAANLGPGYCQRRLYWPAGAFGQQQQQRQGLAVLEV